MEIDKYIKGLMKVFSENTKCDIQSEGCCCNSCFHSQEGDFNHITWLMLLGLRKDYKEQREHILEDIKKELV
jgi:hypothetical protein